MRLMNRFVKNDTGATAIEYGLIAALVSLSLITGYGAFTGTLQNTLLAIDTSVANAGK